MIRKSIIRSKMYLETLVMWCRVSSCICHQSTIYHLPFYLCWWRRWLSPFISANVGNIVVFSSLLSVDSQKTVIIQGECPFYLDISYYNSCNPSDSTKLASSTGSTCHSILTAWEYFSHVIPSYWLIYWSSKLAIEWTLYWLDSPYRGDHKYILYSIFRQRT